MPIEWNLILSPIVKLTIGSTAKILAEKVKNKMLPSELELALKKALGAAKNMNSNLWINPSELINLGSLQIRIFIQRSVQVALFCNLNIRDDTPPYPADPEP
jgi:hypothetical protein